MIEWVFVMSCRGHGLSSCVWLSWLGLVELGWAEPIWTGLGWAELSWAELAFEAVLLLGLLPYLTHWYWGGPVVKESLANKCNFCGFASFKSHLVLPETICIYTSKNPFWNSIKLECSYGKSRNGTSYGWTHSFSRCRSAYGYLDHIIAIRNSCSVKIMPSQWAVKSCEGQKLWGVSIQYV